MSVVVAVCVQSGYSMQMALAPEFANDLHFKNGHPLNKNMSRWYVSSLYVLIILGDVVRVSLW
jgi:hypothetical protein